MIYNNLRIKKSGAVACGFWPNLHVEFVLQVPDALALGRLVPQQPTSPKTFRRDAAARPVFAQTAVQP